jgi:hypothetical protein
LMYSRGEQDVRYKTMGFLYSGSNEVIYRRL